MANRHLRVGDLVVVKPSAVASVARTQNQCASWKVSARLPVRIVDVDATFSRRVFELNADGAERSDAAWAFPGEIRLAKGTAELYAKFGKDLPSDANLSSYLTVDRAFNPAAVGGVIAAYKETLPYVMDGASDTLSGDDPDKQDAEETTGEEDMEAQSQQRDQVPTRRDPPPPPPRIPGEEEYFRARLAGGRMVRVLFQGTPPTQAEIQKLITLLECSKDQYPESEGVA